MLPVQRLVAAVDIWWLCPQVVDRCACLGTDFPMCIAIIACGYVGVYEYCLSCYILWTLVASFFSLFPVLRDTIK